MATRKKDVDEEKEVVSESKAEGRGELMTVDVLSSIPDKIEFIRFEQTDTHGISRSKTVTRKHYMTYAESGLNFIMGHLAFDSTSGIASGTGYLQEIGYADARLMPDSSTLKVVPWADKTARVICEPLFQDGRKAKAHPRFVARQMLDKLNALGYELLSSHEYEFYLVDKKSKAHAFEGKNIFSTLRNNFDEPFVNATMRFMTAMGIDVMTANCEYGPGQMEIVYSASEGITSADNAFTFKNGVKEISQKAGYTASFMTKPYTDHSANGCHFNHSLLSLKDKKPVFWDAKTSSLSDIGRHWLAGLMHHAPAITAFMSPTVNCYKRYKENSFAPTNVSWGIQNRSCAFRVKVDGEKGTYIENRLPGGSSNPYLVFAATIAAGLDGIDRKLELPKPIEGSAYGLSSSSSTTTTTSTSDDKSKTTTESGSTEKKEAPRHLPKSLAQALAELQKDKVICDSLGAEFIKLFVAVKQHEIEKAKKLNVDIEDSYWLSQVSYWELEWFFEFL